MSSDVVDALHWQAERTAKEVETYREKLLAGLEEAADLMWKQGSCSKWLEAGNLSDEASNSTVNGVLLEDLCKAILYHDSGCVEVFRDGAPLFGPLPAGGLGEPKKDTEIGDLEALWQNRAASNKQLLSKLKEDPFAAELHRLTTEDARLGRMTWPKPVEDCDISRLRLSPRFGVDQGLRDDGSQKIRAVDNFSWSVNQEGSFQTKSQKRKSSINGATAMPECMHHDHIDMLALAMKKFRELTSELPGLLKADIDSAFRRVPLRKDHRWAAAIVYMYDGKAWVSVHKACPFGAMSAVHNWERTGALLATLARRVLKIAVLRYVDDFFAPERRDSMKHALECLGRLVCLVMGKTAIAAKKLEAGIALVVLGLHISISDAGFRLLPADKKVQKCIKAIMRALKDKKLHAGCAEKLAGRLCWATQYMFYKLGRAMLRPIFDQKWTSTGEMSPGLVKSLRWWLHILKMGICEEHPWAAPTTPLLHLFVDARGEPAR